MSPIDPTIPVKQAIAIAKQFVSDAFGQAISAIRLEEAEFPESDKPTWVVTLSFRPKDLELVADCVARPANCEDTREFKCIRVDAFTGSILSMKTRKFPPFAKPDS